MLNEEQRKVVYANERFLFLLAGAGSGKTRVIIERISYLINKEVDGSKILAITFTKKAAEEMRVRLKNNEVNIHTFHQLCYENIKKHNQKEPFIIEDEKIPFTKEEKLNFSLYKNGEKRLRKPKKYNEYQAFLNKKNAYDFDDLLLQFYELLSKKAMVNYDYIFIDEFQDTNILQYKILKKMILPNTAVFAVGDPDQSIYAFRGASEKVILQYINDYKASIYKLSLNYRSNASIIFHANQLIKNNDREFKKQLIANNKKTSNVEHLLFKNEDEEAIYVIDWLRTLKTKKTETAILFRYHERSYTLKYYLQINAITYQDQDQLDLQFGINLLTMHQAKGLEFDNVLILGAEKHENRENMIKTDEEERRLMFVAMTRAKTTLMFTSVLLDEQKGRLKQSKFIEESQVKTKIIKHFNGII